MPDETPAIPAADQQPAENKPADPVAEARKVIEEEKVARAKECLKEINEVLKKYNCELKITNPSVGINAL